MGNNKTKKKRQHTKYNTELCDNDISFQDCELAILRHAIDEGEMNIKKKQVNSGEINKLIKILEGFLIKKKLLLYGGTAINNILPKHAQFYDRAVEIPDYDFYSPNAMNDAIELANLYYKHGYTEVEAKAGMHFGTYKVFVNFIPMADITYIPQKLYESIEADAITIDKIRYSPPNFLRMNMYLELSRPAGDIERWDKVLKRLTLLNKYYPFSVEYDCNKVDFQRQMETTDKDSQERIYTVIRDSFIEQGVVFFGGYASSLYGKYMPYKQQKMIKKIPDFDVLAEDPESVSMIILEKLHKMGFKEARKVKHEPLGEIIPMHYEIHIGDELLAFIYEPIACHSYNSLKINGKTINVATIDTMLTFYLAFYYADKSYYNNDRIMCMAQFLYDVQKHNRLEQHGLLKRFSINCYGKQEGLDDIRMTKTAKFKELSGKKKSREYDLWFLKYTPTSVTSKKTKTNPSPETSSPKSPSSESSSPNISSSNIPRIKKHKKKTQKKNILNMFPTIDIV